MPNTYRVVHPLVALLGGRLHYRRLPSLDELVEAGPLGADYFSSLLCAAPFERVYADRGGDPIGAVCRRCGCTATADGRTEYGPRWVVEFRRRDGAREWDAHEMTVLVEPGAEWLFEARASRYIAATDTRLECRGQEVVWRR